jgi:hypothetical protein
MAVRGSVGPCLGPRTLTNQTRREITCFLEAIGENKAKRRGVTGPVGGDRASRHHFEGVEFCSGAANLRNTFFLSLHHHTHWELCAQGSHLNADGVGQLPQLRCQRDQVPCNVQQRVCHPEQPQHLHVADVQMVTAGELVGPQIRL